jgi:hypothetical protein
MVLSLQATVDELAARVGRAIDVEDRRFRLLAYSAHDGPVDGVRRDTILRRAATPAVVERLERLGVPATREPVRLPADPALDMGARVCFPVREGDRLHGYVWVLDEPPLGLDETARLYAGVEAIAAALRTLDDQEDVRQADEQAALDALLTAGATAPARALLAEHGPLRVVVGAPGSQLRPLRRRAGSARALSGEHAGLPVVLLVATEPPTGVALPLGVGAVVADLADARTSHAQAVCALRVARALPRLGPVARYDDLGPYGLLAPLAFAPETALPATLQRLLVADDGEELAATLRVVLDAGEDVSGAARTLHVHRSTLHRRLRRIEELTGADLGDGPTRLELHAGLLVAELRAGHR